MKITLRATLFIAAFTVFNCSGQKGRQVTWFEAQTACRDRNQSITLLKNESDEDYWTGLYLRTSHWIKIIGCYNESTLQYSNHIFLSLSSPPQCQEYCLQNNSHMFAVQGSKCVCLSPDFDVDTENQLPSSRCTYMCSNSTLLSTECGGSSTFNVFLTDMTDLKIENHCISLQCGESPTFEYRFDCDKSLPPLCSSIDNSIIMKINQNWIESMEFCKKNDTYLTGNISLSNVTSACLGYNHSTQRWIGVIKEDYFDTDQGRHINESDKALFNTCQRCKLKNEVPVCELVGCEKKATVICTEEKNVVLPIPDTTYKSTTLQDATDRNVSGTTSPIDSSTSRIDSSTSPIDSPTSPIDSPTSHIDSPTSHIAVSVLLVLFAISGCVIAIIIYKRRKSIFQQKGTKSIHVPAAKESEKYSNTETHNNTNYFVLQQSNPTYELADNSKIESESPYNEVEEGTYDHLGEKKARKRPVDDMYNNATAAEISDLSDYDVANHKHLNSDANTYDHAAFGEESYGKFKSETTDYDVTNRMHRNVLETTDYDVTNRTHRNEEDSTYDRTGVEDNSYGKVSPYQVKETDYSELS